MKRLCIILFILSPCFGQFSEKSFKLVRGEDFFTIRPDQIIKINDKESIYKKIDYKNKQIMVEIYNSEKEKSENIKFKIKNNLNKKVMHVFNVRNSVNLKTSYGGTSTKNIKKMISRLKKEFK